jgi:hypothetical protein
VKKAEYIKKRCLAGAVRSNHDTKLGHFDEMYVLEGFEIF